MARPTDYQESFVGSQWKSEKEMQKFLLDRSNGALDSLIGVGIKEVRKEVLLPLHIGAMNNKGRVDIVVIDENDNWHIIEVKHPKSEILDNSKGIAQLLYYDAMLHGKHGIEVAGMFLITSAFDNISKEIVPRNKLRIKIVKLNRDSLEVVSSFKHKRTGDSHGY